MRMNVNEMKVDIFEKFQVNIIDKVVISAETYENTKMYLRGLLGTPNIIIYFCVN